MYTECPKNKLRQVGSIASKSMYVSRKVCIKAVARKLHQSDDQSSGKSVEKVCIKPSRSIKADINTLSVRYLGVQIKI